MEKTKEYQPMKYFECTADDMHPYNCNPENCIHCNGIKNENHHPYTYCALCRFNG